MVKACVSLLTIFLAEIEFGAFRLQNLTSGGANFTNLPESY